MRADDPACALNTTFEKLSPPVNAMFRLECNRHLESGRRLED